jgi:hypothetical protein
VYLLKQDQHCQGQHLHMGSIIRVSVGISSGQRHKGSGQRHHAGTGQHHKGSGQHHKGSGQRHQVQVSIIRVRSASSGSGQHLQVQAALSGSGQHHQVQQHTRVRVSISWTDSGLSCSENDQGQHQ